MKRLVCIQRFVFENRTYFPGDIIEVLERIARRWVSRGLAKYVDPNEIIKNIYTKHDKVSVVVLVKDALDYVKKCIDSLFKYTDRFELIIVDNASGKETKQYLKSIKCNEYRLITNKANKGVSYGWNQGIKAAKYDYVCFLNSDTLLTDSWLRKMMRGFKYSDNVGMVGPTSNGGATVKSPQVRHDVKAEDIDKYASELLDDYIEAPVVGFCFVVAKKVFDKIGGFDYKRYGLACHEDIDFLFRMRKAGFKSVWSKGAYVHHFGNRTMIEMGINVTEIRKETQKKLDARRLEEDLFVENDAKIEKIEVICDRQIKIGFVTYQDSHPHEEAASTRIRVTWALPYLNAIVSDKYGELTLCDVVVFQTRYSRSDVELAKDLKKSGTGIIADFTDPHWLREYERYNNDFIDMVGLADIVTVCTDKLKATFESAFNKKAYILKDKLDLNLYNRVKEHKDKSSYRILWFGHSCNLISLELAKDDLERLGAEFDITLVCVYNRAKEFNPAPIRNIKIETIEWSNDEVIKQLIDSDISINPKYDNWKSYKSNNKTITAQALGVPCIENNFYSQIKELLSSADVRNKYAKDCRATVEKEYDVKLTAKEWIDYSERILSGATEEVEPLKSKQDITVYTSIIWAYDRLRDDQFINSSVKYKAFLDDDIKSKVWDVQKIYRQFIDPSRQAKIYKVLPHLYLDTEYSIWLDGRMALNTDPQELIDKYLKDADIALFAHHKRDDIYEEYANDSKHLHRKLEPEYLFRMQVERYRLEGFAPHSGLYECTVILRRHTPAVKRLCEEWWAEICAYTVCDQCSFVYVAKKQGIKINTIGGSVWNNSLILRGDHV